MTGSGVLKWGKRYGGFCVAFVIMVSFLPSACAAVAHPEGVADAGTLADTTMPRRFDNGDVVSSLTVNNGKTYTLQYDQKQQVIRFSDGNASHVVVHIPPGLDPSLVGEAGQIRLLPGDLQPYLDRGFLLFLATRRTRAGGGNGKCGAGTEMMLDVLNTRAYPPKVSASFLVGSCAKNINLWIGAKGDSPLYSFAVEAGRLSMQFLSYKEMTQSFGIKGVVSTDLRHLEVRHVPR